MIVDVFLTEVLGKFLAEYLVEVIAGVSNPFVARDQQGEVRHHEDTFEQRHGAFVEIFPHLVADKKKLGLGVVDDVMHIVRLEFVKMGTMTAPYVRVARKVIPNANCYVRRRRFYRLF